MPTYDYECDACGHRFELFQSMSDKPKRKCPECKKSKLQRIIGIGAGLIFKGSGFYRSASYKAGEKADAPKPEAKACGMDPKTGVCGNQGCGSGKKKE